MGLKTLYVFQISQKGTTTEKEEFMEKADNIIGP